MKKQLFLMAALMLSSMIELNAIQLGPNQILINDEAQFATVLERSPRMVLFMYSNECQACVMPKVYLSHIAGEMPDVIFVYLNADNNALAHVIERYKSRNPNLVDGLPTIKAFRNGNEVGEIGAPATEALLELQIAQYFGIGQM